MTRFSDPLWNAVAKQHQELNGDNTDDMRCAENNFLEIRKESKMKVAEYWKLVEAKAVELCDLLNSLLKLS